MTELTPVSSLIGGALIGLAASVLLAGLGRVAGISGICGGVLLGPREERGWRTLFLSGLLLGGALFGALIPGSIGASPRPLAMLALAGVIVGFGTRIGSGCTSGHGVCGVSRLAPRSIVATATFVVTGMLTVALLRVLGVVS
jgi:uncharacterized membrane protein YedE/YeeE